MFPLDVMTLQDTIPCGLILLKSLAGADNFPNTLNDPLNLLSHYRPPVTHTIPRYGGGKISVAQM